MKDFLYLKDDQIREFLELINITHRNVNTIPKNLLLEKVIGPAHIRTLKKIEKKPGINFSELMFELKVTKQSLNRVLRSLIKHKYIKQKKSNSDTRVKEHFLEQKGKNFYTKVFDIQKKIIMNALIYSDPVSVINFKKVLNKLANDN